MADVLQYLAAGAYETISPGDTSTGITAAIRAPTSGAFKNLNAMAALVTVEDNTIRFTLDSTAATASVGHLMSAGQSYVIQHESDVVNFRCIDAVSGATGNIKVTTFFRR